MSLVLVLTLILRATLVIFFAVAAQNQQCVLCPGSDISHPEKELHLPDFPFIDSCATLNSSIGLLLTEEDEKCLLIQSLSSLCGCPSANINACVLCELPEQLLGFPEKELPFLSSLFDGFTPTCELLNAYLTGNVLADDRECTSLQNLLGLYCGCGVDVTVGVVNSSSQAAMCTMCPLGESVPLPDKALGIPNFPLQTCHQLDLAVNALFEQSSTDCTTFQSFSTYCGCLPSLQVTTPCSMCWDGSKVPMPNTTIPSLSMKFLDIAPTCGILEAYVQSVSATDDKCAMLQLLGALCSCPALMDHCLFDCPNNQIPEAFQKRKVHQFTNYVGDVGFDPSCVDVVNIGLQITADSLACRAAKSKQFICGCGKPFYTHNHLVTLSDQRASVWLPRVSAILSLLGSAWIVYDSLSNKKKQVTMYHQLLVAMSTFDIIGDLAIAFSTGPIPKFDKYGNPGGIYGSFGNNATCTAQGFFIQLSLITIFYNIALSCYYQLTIVHGWKEQKLQKYKLCFHVPTVLTGFGLAFAGIPYYGLLFFVCWIPPHPFEARWVGTLFAIAPFSIVMIVSTLSMLRVMWFVETIHHKSKKWHQGSEGRKNSFVSEVRWQSCFYLGAFYVSYPILIAEFALRESAQRGNTLWFLSIILFPLRGFLSKTLHAMCNRFW